MILEVYVCKLVHLFPLISETSLTNEVSYEASSVPRVLGDIMKSRNIKNGGNKLKFSNLEKNVLVLSK